MLFGSAWFVVYDVERRRSFGRYFSILYWSQPSHSIFWCSICHHFYIGVSSTLMFIPWTFYSSCFDLFLGFQSEFEFIQRFESFIAIKNHPSKLLCDFLLFMCVCRQQSVFCIEKKNGSRKYPGGRNASSVDEINRMICGQLPIRTHDFLYPTNWLDILKCVVYYSSFWVTLTIVLLTGTNNISAFSLGYLVSSFLFCYTGTNFYMKPIQTILQSWNKLIAFNVLVIVVKSMINLRLIIDGTFLSHQMVASMHEFLNEV